MKVSSQSLLRKNSHSCILSCRIQQNEFFSETANEWESVSISISLCLFVFQYFVQQTCDTAPAYCRIKKSTIMGSSTSIPIFTSNTSKNWSITWASLLKGFLLIAACVLSTFSFFSNRMATRPNNSITTEFVGKKYHCFWNNNGIRIFVYLLSSANSRLSEIVEASNQSLVKGAVNFRAYDSQLQLKQK